MGFQHIWLQQVLSTGVALVHAAIEGSFEALPEQPSRLFRLASGGDQRDFGAATHDMDPMCVHERAVVPL